MVVELVKFIRNGHPPYVLSSTLLKEKYHLCPLSD